MKSRTLRIARKLALPFLLLAATAVACAHASSYGAAAFRVDSNVKDATVWVDDVLIGTVSDWAKEGRHIRPGFHRIEVRHPGYYSFFQEIELTEGSGTVIRAELRPTID